TIVYDNLTIDCRSDRISAEASLRKCRGRVLERNRLVWPKLSASSSSVVVGHHLKCDVRPARLRSKGTTGVVPNSRNAPARTERCRHHAERVLVAFALRVRLDERRFDIRRIQHHLVAKQYERDASQPQLRTATVTRHCARTPRHEKLVAEQQQIGLALPNRR